jgi:D-ribose pyranase
MAEEFIKTNPPDTCKAFTQATTPIPLRYESHLELKKRAREAIGLIRTGDTIQFANRMIVSGPLEQNGN